MFVFLFFLSSIIAIGHALPSSLHNDPRALPIGGLDSEGSESHQGVVTRSTTTINSISKIRVPNLAGLGYLVSIEDTKAFDNPGSDQGNRISFKLPF